MSHRNFGIMSGRLATGHTTNRPLATRSNTIAPIQNHFSLPANSILPAMVWSTPAASVTGFFFILTTTSLQRNVSSPASSRLLVFSCSHLGL